MDNSDVLQRNAAGELEVRVVNGTEKADAPANYDDVFTVNSEGKRALRVVGAGGGGGGTTPTAADVSFDPAGLKTITADNVQSALQQVDAALPQNIQYTHIGTTENMQYGSWVNPFVKAGVLADGEYYFYVKSYRASGNNPNGDTAYGYITNKITFTVSNNLVDSLHINPIMDGDTVSAINTNPFSSKWDVTCFQPSETNEIDIYFGDILGSDYLMYLSAPTTPVNLILGSDIYTANGTIIPIEYEFVQSFPDIAGHLYFISGNAYVDLPSLPVSVSIQQFGLIENTQYFGFVCCSYEIMGPNTGQGASIYPIEMNIALIIDAENIFVGKASVNYGGIYKSEIMVATGVFENMVFVVYQNSSNQYYLGIAKADNSGFTLDTSKTAHLYVSWYGTGQFHIYFEPKTNDTYPDYTVLQNIPVIPTLPNAPTADGTYIPELTITGGVQSVSWVAKSA